MGTVPTPSDPREAEANGSTASVEFRGETFSIPLEYADYSLSFIEAAADGAPAVVQVRELLGPEQWTRVRALRLDGAGFDELVAAVQKAEGTDAGNLEASSA